LSKQDEGREERGKGRVQKGAGRNAAPPKPTFDISTPHQDENRGHAGRPTIGSMLTTSAGSVRCFSGCIDKNARAQPVALRCRIVQKPEGSLDQMAHTRALGCNSGHTKVPLMRSPWAHGQLLAPRFRHFAEPGGADVRCSQVKRRNSPRMLFRRFEFAHAEVLGLGECRKNLGYSSWGGGGPLRWGPEPSFTFH